MGNGPVDEAMAAYQRTLPVEAAQDERDLKAVLQTAFTELRGLGHLDAAIRVGRKLLELAPGNVSIAYLLKAVSGATDVERSPPAYLVECFDGYAESFDEKLVQGLHYDVPATLCSAVERLAGPGRRFYSLDIGCGTGLCGPLLRPMSAELIGVDVSPRMLEQARRRGVYDELLCADLPGCLERWPARFDLVIAADLLIYFGDLRPLWAALTEVLRPGGLLAFNTERLEDEGYRLLPSGRFAHSLAYVRSISEGLCAERSWGETTIRLEARKPVPGHYFVLSRP